MRETGQGGLEYLLLIGGGVLVAAIVISVVTSVPGGEVGDAIDCRMNVTFGGCLATSGCQAFAQDGSPANGIPDFYYCDFSGTEGGGTGPEPCEDDAGCSSAGGFCEGDSPYTCSMGGDGCLDRANGAACTDMACAAYSCDAGSCLADLYDDLGTSCGAGRVCDGQGSCTGSQLLENEDFDASCCWTFGGTYPWIMNTSGSGHMELYEIENDSYFSVAVPGLVAGDEYVVAVEVEYFYCCYEPYYMDAGSISITLGGAALGYNGVGDNALPVYSGGSYLNAGNYYFKGVAGPSGNNLIVNLYQGDHDTYAEADLISLDSVKLWKVS